MSQAPPPRDVERGPVDWRPRPKIVAATVMGVLAAVLTAAFPEIERALQESGAPVWLVVLVTTGITSVAGFPKSDQP